MDGQSIGHDIAPTRRLTWREPRWRSMVLAWVVAGPLNPIPFVISTIALGLSWGQGILIPQETLAHWILGSAILVSLPSSIAAAYALPYLRKGPLTWSRLWRVPAQCAAGVIGAVAFVVCVVFSLFPLALIPALLGTVVYGGVIALVSIAAALIAVRALCLMPHRE